MEHKSSLSILDGGLSETLFRMGVPDDRKIWSARALVEEKYHGTVMKAHQQFITSGAEIVTTANYAATPYVLKSAGLEKRFAALVEIAGKLARQAVEKAGSNTLVAGCIPPLVESYRPDLVMDFKDAEPQLMIICKSLDPYVDFFLAETQSSIQESEQSVRVASRFGKPVWASVTLAEDGSLRSGEAFLNAVKRLRKQDAEAVLINCSTPEAVSKALATLDGEDLGGVRIGVYANALPPVQPKFSFGTEEAAASRGISCEEYLKHASKWRKMGASIIGGCCCIYPEHVAALTDGLKRKAAK